MHQFIKNFIRVEAGKWVCVTSAEFNGPNGRIQVSAGNAFARGETYMGLDLAQCLDDQYEKNRLH